MRGWPESLSVCVAGLGQKNGPTDNTICHKQLVDGEITNDSGACRMSAPAVWANSQKKF